MRMRIALPLTLCVMFVAFPVWCYDNGPVNGQVDAWVINFGFSVTDSVQVNAAVTALIFYAWTIPGDTISSVQVQLGSSPFGNNLFDGVVTLTQSNCFSNQYGYNVCAESGNFSGPTLSGNAWLTLQNANVPSGDPVYWDENSGVGCQSPGCPSSAQENTIGTIPSEAFTIGGCLGGPPCGTTTTTTGTTPEPSSVLLLGSGILGLVAILRRKVF